MKKILCAIAVVTTVSLMGCGTVQKENPAGIAQEQKVSETTTQEITVNLMALAAGNSLVENQVQLVVQDWKQNHKAELSDFQKKMEVVYKEYEMLAAGDTEAELKKAGFTLEGYEYCGNGKLDMVEWIYSDIQS